MKRLILILLTAGAAGLAQGSLTPLSLQEAEATAIKNHPQIQVAQDAEGVAGQGVVEARSAYYPTLNGEITASQANTDARIGAGALSPSRMANRFGQGIVFSQLITDSGRTHNLVASSRLHSEATQQDTRATRYDVLRGVDQAYFNVLRAQATVRVAEETVRTRSVLENQVSELTRNKLRSQLDLSFADVNVSEAKLLLIRAQNQVQTAFAELSRAMGLQETKEYRLSDSGLPDAPPGSVNDLVTEAIRNRPELQSLHLEIQSAERTENAERDLSRPTVSLVGVAGFLPLSSRIGGAAPPTEYEGAAVNIDIPVFNGHLFSARRRAAHYRFLATQEKARDQEQQIVRDVRIAWDNSRTAYQRMSVTAELLKQANLALDLAQGRYDLGLASIVELSQAQLGVTQAQIENLTAKYDYQDSFAALQYVIGRLR